MIPFITTIFICFRDYAHNRICASAQNGEKEKWDIEEEEEDTPETGPSEICPHGRGRVGYMDAEEDTAMGTTREIQLGVQGFLGCLVGGGPIQIIRERLLQYQLEHQLQIR
jgi:hypothetical protein